MFTLKSLRTFAFTLAACGLAPAWAEKADRTRPMTLESDPGKPCIVNLVKQTSRCSGNVVITQGTLLMKADTVELRETPEGHRMATATGTSDKLAHYRQKRDGVDEFVEGSALRIDYDGRAGTLRFVGRAQVRRLRGAVVADEIHGETIVWDSNAEQFSVLGGAPTAANPGGRVRAVLAPREVAPAPAATTPAATTPAATSPAATPASAARPAPALRTTPSLEDRR